MKKETDIQYQMSILLTSIEKMRELDAEIQAQTIAVFLTVAKSPMPVKMQDISKELGLAQSSVSRNVAYLGDWTRHREKGKGLLEAYEDPMERRRKLVKLTKKGERFAEKLFETINERKMTNAS